MELNEKVEFEADKLEHVRSRFKAEISGLCGRCQHSHIFKTPRDPDLQVFCREFEYSRQVPDNISECNRFAQIGVLSIWELAKLALDVDISPKRDVGFRQKGQNEISSLP